MNNDKMKVPESVKNVIRYAMSQIQDFEEKDCRDHGFRRSSIDKAEAWINNVFMGQAISHTRGQESEAQAWLIEKVLIDGTSEIEPLYLAAWSHHGQLDEGGYEVVFTKNPHKAIRFDSEKKARGLMHIAENLKATSHIFESEAQADILDEEEFYNICQHYRWAKDNGDAGQAFENLKCFIRRIAPPSAIVIETAAKLQAAEVCIRATPDREMVKGIGEAAHYIASGNAIRATIPQDGITELERFGMKVADAVVDHCYEEFIEKNRSVDMDEVNAIVSSLIGEK